MIKKKILLYPYDAVYEALLNYNSLSEFFDILFLIHGYEIRLNNNTYKKFFTYGLTTDEINALDYIYITESANKLSMETVLNTLNSFANTNKQLIISNQFHEKPELESFCKENGIRVMELSDLQKYIGSVDEIALRGIKLYKINVPVILILGLSPNTQKFELQLYLRDKFINKGYKVGQIGTRECCELLGFHSYPQFMTDRKHSEVKKIYLYNNFIKEIELKEKPDVIIISAPNAIMSLSERQLFNFGIEAYQICNSVKPDFTILTAPNGEYNDDFFKEMMTVCKYKHNVDVNMFFVSDYVAISHSIEDDEVSFSKIDVKNNHSDIFNVCNSADMYTSAVFNTIEHTLLDYNEVVQL